MKDVLLFSLIAITMFSSCKKIKYDRECQKGPNITGNEKDLIGVWYKKRYFKYRDGNITRIYYYNNPDHYVELTNEKFKNHRVNEDCSNYTKIGRFRNPLYNPSWYETNYDQWKVIDNNILVNPDIKVVPFANYDTTYSFRIDKLTKDSLIVINNVTNDKTLLTKNVNTQETCIITYNVEFIDSIPAGFFYIKYRDSNNTFQYDTLYSNSWSKTIVPPEEHYIYFVFEAEVHRLQVTSSSDSQYVRNTQPYYKIFFTDSYGRIINSKEGEICKDNGNGTSSWANTNIWSQCDYDL